MAGMLFEEVIKFNPYHGKDGRFSSANGSAGSANAPENYDDGSGYDKNYKNRHVSDEERAAFKERIDYMAMGLYMRDPKNCVAVGKEISKEIDRRFKLRKKAKENEFDQPQIEDVYDVLKDIRKFGPPEGFDRIKTAEGNDIFQTIPQNEAQAMVANAMDRFPSGWFVNSSSYSSCEVYVVDQHGRARYSYAPGYGETGNVFTYAKTDPKIVQDLSLPTDRIANLGIENQIVHELGHHFEWANWDVGDAARSFYEKRTKNSEITSMFNGEETRADKFAEEYMGRVYSDGATEIISVLSQRLGYANPKETITRGMLGETKDPESYNFILGLMAGGSRDWNE